MIDFLIKLSIFSTPFILLLLCIFGVVWYSNNRKKSTSRLHKALKDDGYGFKDEDVKSKISAEADKVTSINPTEWEDDTTETIPDSVGSRVYRIYRSSDRIRWVECDPAFTERAACNYADYIKKSNPSEFVRCDDPTGITLFFE